jgi:hypothetical protein
MRTSYWITLAEAGSPTITLDGSVITGTLVGTAPNTCWVGYETANDFVYRADITSKVAGNGRTAAMASSARRALAAPRSSSRAISFLPGWTCTQ